MLGISLVITHISYYYREEIISILDDNKSVAMLKLFQLCDVSAWHLCYILHIEQTVNSQPGSEENNSWCSHMRVYATISSHWCYTTVLLWLIVVTVGRMTYCQYNTEMLCEKNAINSWKQAWPQVFKSSCGVLFHFFSACSATEVTFLFHCISLQQQIFTFTSTVNKMQQDMV